MGNGRSTYDQRTIEFFDSIAEVYRSYYNESTMGGYKFVLRRERVLELFDKPGGRVLDVGCGPGVIVEALLAQGCSYYGVDPSAGMIREAKRHYHDRADITFSLGSATEIEYPDDHFEAVLCMGVLERVEDDDRALAEMVRVIKPGGTLIVTLPNCYSPYFLWRDYVFYPVISLLRPLYFAVSRKVRRPSIPGHRLYSVKDITRRLEGKGCAVRDVGLCVYSFLPPPFESWCPRLAVTLMRTAEPLRRGALRNLGAILVVKGRKSDGRAVALSRDSEAVAMAPAVRR